MSLTCPQCSAELPNRIAFCPNCGLRMVAAPSASSTGQFQERLFGALAYFSFIPAVVFLRLNQTRKSHFIRFHCWQSILLTLSAIVLAIAVRIFFSVVAIIPHLGFLLGWLVGAVSAIGLGVLWLLLVVKALQGETFDLPWIGAWAERMS